MFQIGTEEDYMITLQGEVETIRFHFIALRAAVKLEKIGMKRSHRPSAKAIAIKELQLKRNSSYDEVIAAISKRLGE